MSIITNLRFNRHINVTVLRCPIIYNISYGWKNVGVLGIFPSKKT
nr:Mobile element protein [Escherichia coli]